MVPASLDGDSREYAPAAAFVDEISADVGVPREHAADAGARWVAIDPTNRGRAGETHVKIRHGRHYQDVAPIRGVYRGPATGELIASVEMRRLNEEGGG